MPQTFALLTANVRQFATANTTLINAAVSDRLEVLGMEMPSFASGLSNYYRAHLVSGSQGLQVLTVPVDALGLDGRVKLAKIDAEGHEATVLASLVAIGYRAERLPGSPNVLLRALSV